MSRLSEADVEKSCKPKDAATEGFCFQQTMIRVKVGIERVFADVTFCCINYAIIDYIDVGDGLT